MATIVSDKFHFDRDECVMSADITDIGGDSIWEQAYPDAADAGFRIVSQRTGRSVMFAVHEEIRTMDDLVGWRLKAVKTRGARDPILDRLSVVVYND